MNLRRTVTGLALCLMALTMLMACVETGPPPPPPMVETPPPPPSSSTYFVNVSSLALREGPTTAAPQISTLQFNDEVALQETSDGWGRVVDVRRNIVGWASMRYLQPYPASGPRSVPRRSTPKQSSPTPKEEPPAPQPSGPPPKVM
ncbi:MAG: SH3 domain-containing protein [Deltaproteobacteria bacterium]|nr:SH3 domain-containing protein [Deltaproteobacteria bacterium]